MKELHDGGITDEDVKILTTCLINLQSNAAAAGGVNNVVADGKRPLRTPQEITLLVVKDRFYVTRRVDKGQVSPFETTSSPRWAQPAPAGSAPSTAADASARLNANAVRAIADEYRRRDVLGVLINRRPRRATTKFSGDRFKKGTSGRAVYPIDTRVVSVTGPTGGGKSRVSLKALLRAANEDPRLRIEIYCRDLLAAAEMAEKVSQIQQEDNLLAPHNITATREGRFVTETGPNGERIFRNCERGAELESMSRAAPDMVTRTICGSASNPKCPFRLNCRFFENGDDVATANVLIMAAARLSTPRTQGEKRPPLKKPKASDPPDAPRQRTFGNGANFPRLMIMVDEGLEELEVAEDALDPDIIRRANIPLANQILDAIEAGRDVFETLLRDPVRHLPLQEILQGDMARATALKEQARILADLYTVLDSMPYDQQGAFLAAIREDGREEAYVLLQRLHEALELAMAAPDRSGLGAAEKLAWHAPRKVENATTESGTGIKILRANTFDRLNDAELVLLLDATPPDDVLGNLAAGLDSVGMMETWAFNPPTKAFHVRYFTQASKEQMVAVHREDPDRPRPEHWKWLGLSSALAMSIVRRGPPPGYVSRRSFLRMHNINFQAHDAEGLYFYAQRGSNKLENCNMITMIGDPRRPAFAAIDRLIVRDPVNPFLSLADEDELEPFTLDVPYQANSNAPDMAIVKLPKDANLRNIVLQDIMAEAAHAAGRLRAVHIDAPRLLYTVGITPPAAWFPISWCLGPEDLKDIDNLLLWCLWVMHRHGLKELPLNFGLLEQIVGPGNVMGGALGTAKWFREAHTPDTKDPDSGSARSLNRLNDLLTEIHRRLPLELQREAPRKLEIIDEMRVSPHGRGTGKRQRKSKVPTLKLT